MSRAGAVHYVAGQVLGGQDAGATLRIGEVVELAVGQNECRLDIFEEGWLPFDRDLRLRLGDRVYALVQGPIGVVIGALGHEGGPRQKSVTVARQLTAADLTDRPDIDMPGGEYFPNISPNLQVWVPEWAVTCAHEAFWHGVKFEGPDGAGFVWVEFGGLNLASCRWDAPSGIGNVRLPLSTADDFTVPEAMRGTWQLVAPRGGEDVPGGAPLMDSSSAFSATFTFTGTTT